MRDWYITTVRLEGILGFCYVDCITGIVLDTEIKKMVQGNNIDIEYFRGQCYDGADDMIGKKPLIVQAIMNKAAIKTLNTYCSSNCLNIVAPL